MNNHTPLTNIGALLRKARKAKGLTLAQVSEMTGISVSYLSDIELSHRPISPSAKTLLRLQQVLGIECFAIAEIPLTIDEHALIDAWRNNDLSIILQMIASKMGDNDHG